MHQPTEPATEPRAPVRIGALQPSAQLHASGHDASRWARAVRLLHGSALLAAVLCGMAVLALGAWLVRSGVVHIEGVDTNVIFTIQKVLLGHALYTDPALPPFEIAQYGPVFYLLVAGLARLSGLVPFDGEGVALFARSASLLISLGLAGLVYRFARDHAGAGRAVGIMTAGFGFVATSPWYFVARPDGLMALALLGCLYCVLRGEGTGSGDGWKWFALAGVLAFVAAFTKQNGVSALVIALGFLMMRREWRPAAVVLAAFAGSTAVAGVAASPLLGDFVRANVIDGLDNGVNLRAAFANTYAVFFWNFAGLLALLLYVLLRWMRAGTSAVRSMLIVSLGWLFFFSTATAIKVGSALNYYNEFILVGALAVAAFVSERRGTQRTAVPAFAAIASLMLLVFLPIWTGRQLIRYGVWLEESHRIGWYEEVVRHLRAEIPAGSETLVLGPRAFATALPERAVVPQPELQRLAHRRGSVDYSLFRRYVADGRIGYVVHWREHSLFPFLGADFGPFVRVREIGPYAIYVHPTILAPDPAPQ
jgi:hypothetical protein